MNIQKFKGPCNICDQEHEISINNITEEQRLGKEPLLKNFICPNLATMYLLTSYVLDMRSTELKYNPEFKQHFIEIFGIEDFDNKLKRFIDIDLNVIGLPEEYYKMLKAIVESYSCGYFYPAMIGAGALGERVLNRLIIKTRTYYKSSPHYKTIYKKDSFDNWDKIILILCDWNIISKEMGNMFSKLQTYRHRSVHYNENYNFEINAQDAIKILIKIIKKLFDISERADIFWVCNSPGEVLVKSTVLNDPFVIEFILPNCKLVLPSKEPCILKPISDEEFIKLRKNNIIK